MAVITLDEAKVFLQITGTSKDDLIEALIPEIEADWSSYCNRTFTDPWPSGMKLTSARMIGYQLNSVTSIGLQSESQGEYSYSKGASSKGQYPDEITKAMDLFKYTRAHIAKTAQVSRDRRGLSIEELAKDVYVQGIEGEKLED